MNGEESREPHPKPQLGINEPPLPPAHVDLNGRVELIIQLTEAVSAHLPKVHADEIALRALRSWIYRAPEQWRSTLNDLRAMCESFLPMVDENARVAIRVAFATWADASA